MYSNAVSAWASSKDANPGGGAGQSGNSTEAMFMQLLLTQLQHQDPLSPMDPSTFVDQLVQVTSLEQVTQINQLLQTTLGSDSSPAPSSASGGQ